jgi:hypothetical protein
MTVYPEYPWISPKSSSHSSKAQESLQSILMDLFDGIDVQFNFQHPFLKYSNSRRPMELDAFIPSLNIAFEYQGEQHYSQRRFGEVTSQKERDLEKLESCKTLGITLIRVPYWWDGTKESLQSLIKEEAPTFHLRK